MIFLFKQVIFSFHVNFQGCNREIVDFPSPKTSRFQEYNVRFDEVLIGQGHDGPRTDSFPQN